MSRVAALDARLVGAGAGGDSTYWSGLLHGLARTDAGWRFLLLYNAAKPPPIPSDPRFEPVCVPARSQRWWSLVSFPLAARRAGAHVIHTQYNLSPLAAGRGVTLIHDVSFFIGPEWFSTKDRLLLRRFVPGSARRAAQVLTVSETSAAEIASHIPAARGKIAVTPLAVNPAVVPCDPERARQIVRERLGLAGPYLLSVATRCPRKNIALAVEAASLLPGDLPHRLALTGRGRPGGTAGAHPRIAELGNVPDDLLGPLYSAASLYLCPSHHEGFGLPVLEAFACECPVLCSAGGALPEVSGGAALVEPSKDPESWARRIGEILADSSKLAGMRRLGLERARAFDWLETARRTLAAYERAAR
jgi:glycosyltransferase involved in cell wall biosynthesis